MAEKSIPDSAGEITLLLERLRAGDRKVESRLIPLVYMEMRRLAARHMGHERSGHTLQPTALVHEAYLRIFRFADINFRNRTHFYAVAARVMRRILVDHARELGATKRGGSWVRLTLDDLSLGKSEPGVDVLDVLTLDGALHRLESISARPARVVEMLFFAGMSIEDAAVALGTSERTVKRDWAAAKAWLHKEIYGKHRALAKTQ